MTNQIHAFFDGGIDQDSELRFMSPKDYRHAVNLRIGASQEGNTGSAENIKGNIPIINISLPDANFKTIGQHEDKQNSKIYFFIADLDKTRNKHGIYEYNNTTQAITPIYINPKLKFHEHNLITGTAYTNGQLFWCDGTELAVPYESGEYLPGQKVNYLGQIYMAYVLTSGDPTTSDWVLSQNPNPPREINIFDAKKGLYDNIDFADSVNFDMIKIPPFFPPVFSLSYDGTKQNYMNKSSFQFCARNIYRDAQKSVFSVASELAITGYSDKPVNKITVAIPLLSDNSNHYDYAKVIKYIQIAVRSSYINPYKAIKTIPYPSPVTILGNIDSVMGTDVMGVGFSAITAGSGLYQDLPGKIYIGTVLSVNNDNSITLTANASTYAGPINIIFATNINGNSYQAYVDFYNDEAYPIITDDVTSKAFDSVPRYIKAMTFCEGKIFIGNHVENFNTQRNTSAILTLGAGATMNTGPVTSDRKILKPGSRYQLGLECKDYAGRTTFVYTNDLLKLNTAPQVGNNYFANYLDNLNIDDSTLDDFVKYEGLLISENLTDDWFVQGRVEHVYYNTKYTAAQIPVFQGSAPDPETFFNDAVAGNYDYITKPNAPGSVAAGVPIEAWFDISNWLKFNTNIAYTFQPGDLLNVYTTGGDGTHSTEADINITNPAYLNLKIKKQVGDFVVTGVTNPTFYGIDATPTNTNEITVVGEGGALYSSIGSPGVFYKVNTGTTLTLRAVSYARAGAGFAVGDNGIVLNLMNATTAEVRTLSAGTNNLYSIDSLDSTFYAGCGDKGTLFYINVDNNDTPVLLTGPAGKKLVSINVASKITTTTWSVVFISEDGIYYRGVIDITLNTFTVTTTIVIPHTKLNKITTYIATGDEYSWACGVDTENNLGSIVAFKNGVRVYIAGNIFASGTQPEILAISCDWGSITTTITHPSPIYNTAITVFLTCVDIAGQFFVHTHGSKTNASTGSFDFTAFQSNLAPLVSDPYFVARGGALNTPIYDIDTEKEPLTYPAGDLTYAAYRGVVAGVGVSSSAFRFFIDASDGIGMLTSSPQDIFAIPILSLLNYKCKIEIHRPKKSNSEVFFYESILSTGGYGGQSVPSRYYKRGQIPINQTIGRIDEGDCFYIPKTFQGTRWNIVSDHVISMSPDNGNTTGSYISSDGTTGLNTFVNEGWNKGNSRPNIVYDGVESEQKNLTEMRFSNNYIVNSPINGLCSFDEFNSKIFPIEYIALNKIGVVTDNQINGNVLLAIFSIEAASIYLNRTQYTDATGKRQLGLSDQVLGSFNTLIGGYGTVNAESVVFEKSRAYWWDATKGSWCRYGNDGITPLSETYGLRNRYKVFSKRIKNHKGNPFQFAIATYDLLMDEMVGTVTNLSDTTDGDTVAFSENIKRFTTFYDFGLVPEFYSKINQSIVSFVNGQLWLHGANSLYNDFYGVHQDSSMRVISNGTANATKSHRSIKITATDKWSADFTSTLKSNGNLPYTTAVTLDDMAVYNEDENMLYADIRRVDNTPGNSGPNGWQMRGAYLISDLKLDPDVTWLSNLYFVDIGFNDNMPSK